MSNKQEQTMKFHALLKTLNKARETHDATLKSAGRGRAIKAQIATYLASALPKGIAVEWTQCTPYYNGGEPCRFRANPPALFQAAPDDDVFPDAAFFIDGPGHHEVPGLTRAHIRAFVKAWKTLPLPLLENAFGDGTRVRVNSNGSFTAKEYLGD